MLFPVACGIARKEGAGVNDFGAEPAGIPDANASSKSAIRLLTADAAMPSRDAARVRFFSSQTAMNSRSVVRSIRRSSALSEGPAVRGASRSMDCSGMKDAPIFRHRDVTRIDGAKILKFGRNDALRWELIPTERLEKRLSFQPSLRGA
jgi:hypothetical protein